MSSLVDLKSKIAYYALIMKKLERFCSHCKTAIESRKAKYCKDCRKQCQLSTSGLFSVSSQTKGNLRLSRSGYQSFRTAIRKDSDSVFDKSGKERICIVCGYKTHIQVCHVDSVSSFLDSSLISEINRIDNLVPLCPNHHWEFDNGLIDLAELRNCQSRESGIGPESKAYET